MQDKAAIVSRYFKALHGNFVKALIYEVGMNQRIFGRESKPHLKTLIKKRLRVSRASRRAKFRKGIPHCIVFT